MRASPFLFACVLFFGFACFPFVSGASSDFHYPGHPTNWVIRVGGSFGQDVDNVSPGAPYFAMKFYPADIEIFNLDTVTWVFNGSEPHTVSFIDGVTFPISPLDARIQSLQKEFGLNYFDNSTSRIVSSGLRMTGSLNYTLTFNQTGNFPYLCAIHPSMVGRLHVRSWSETLGKTSDDVLAQGNDELSADETYALGDFIKQANLLDPVPYTEDSDGYRTWNVWEGVFAQPPDWNVSGVGPISAYDFFPGSGVFNITEGDRIKFINKDEIIHTLAFQTNSSYIPFGSTNYILSYIPDSQVSLTYTGGFQDYGLLVPLDPLHNNKTITFSKEGTYYVFCTIHSNLGMSAQINVIAENESENNQTTTGNSQTSSTGVGATGIHPGQSSTGNINPAQSSTGGGTGLGTGGNKNSAPASAIVHPVIVLLTSLVGIAAMTI